MYYLIDNHYIAVIVAGVCSFAITHFSLEASYDFRYSFVHACFMVVSTFIFAVAVYFYGNDYISYDFSMVYLVLINWLIPFIYSEVRDINDHGPHFDGYIAFFHKMSVLFMVLLFVTIVKIFFLTPIMPPFKNEIFGAHNFVPYMSTGEYFEKAIKSGANMWPEYRFLLELLFVGIPIGFYIALYCKKMHLIPRIIIYIGIPTLLEFIQYAYSRGYASIDDVCTMVFGEIIGVIIYHIVDSAYYYVNKRHFLETRDSIKGFNI
ncbi:MAG: hypothetical protein K6D02_05215 [Lachnospiraceae bacterium]|nr:hypothetical protein [Lachnospiraceae bacterium]